MEFVFNICKAELLDIKCSVQNDQLNACCQLSTNVAVFKCSQCQMGPFCSYDHLVKHQESLPHAIQCIKMGDTNYEHVNKIAALLGCETRKMAFKRNLMRHIKFNIDEECQCRTNTCECAEVFKVHITNKDKNSPFSQVDLNIRL